MDGRILQNNFYFFPISQIIYPIFYILISSQIYSFFNTKKRLCPNFCT
jgi:hypothetical protein